MSENHRYFRVRIQVEQQRFLSFAMEGGLLYEDRRICTTLQVNHIVLRDVLLQVKSLFEQFEEKNKKYGKLVSQENVSWDDRGEPRTNLMELLSVASIAPTGMGKAVEDKQRLSLSEGIRKLGDQTTTAARKLRTIFAEPRRLIWVSVDKEEFQDLVDRLEHFNSFLMGLLDSTHVRNLGRAVEMNYLELLQLRDDVKGLKSLTKALDRESSGHHRVASPFYSASWDNEPFESAIRERKADEAKRRYLRALTELKIRHIEVDQPEEPNISPISSRAIAMPLNISSFGFCQDDLKRLHGGHPKRRCIATWGDLDVWVEWIERQSRYQRDSAAEFVSEDRVMLLTRLLCEDMPPGFRVPRCLGYTKWDPGWNQRAQFGLVYEAPRGKDSKFTLITLRRILNYGSEPPITARISLSSALADSLFSFLAIDWLHKGLRSENILFFGEEVADTSLSIPYITGYDLAQPSEASEMDEEPPVDPWSDIYLHPNVQSGGARNFYRKSYDMYSLGIILLEIALWRPIETILGIEDLKAIGVSELRGIRGKLLGLHEERERGEFVDNLLTPPGSSKYLKEIAHKCGDSYRDIVELCLRASEAEKPAYRGESRGSMRSRLQIMFKQEITDKLQLMKEVLSKSD